MAKNSLRQQSIGTTNCLDYETIKNDGGEVVENRDGSVSVYLPTVNDGQVPIILSKICCEYINSGFTFDIDTQTCRWSPIACGLDDTIKLVLNPKGNDGSLFYVEPNDSCFLKIDFDYLFKIKCETLSDILNGQRILPKNVIDEQNRIGGIKIQINEQAITCENISNKLEQLIYEFNNTSYSISCENLPVTPQYEKSVGKLDSFTRTGFGSNIAPFSFTKGDTVVAGQNYCLTEPNGLNRWREIIGDVNYEAFINGDSTSFTCSDVESLFNENGNIILNNIFNGTNNPILMIECDTPFGVKSELAKEISGLERIKKVCSDKIASLSNQISSLSIEPTCSTPLDVFENFDVSLTLDIITSANTLQTILELPLFSQIGTGNLYDYLTNTTNSGFYVCGNLTDTCIPLSFNLTDPTQTNDYSCDGVLNNIIEGLFNESGLSGTSGANDIFINSLQSNALASDWLHFSTGITDSAIIDLISNQKIKISIKINNTCGDFCVLIDEISLDKVCSHVETKNIFLTQSPGFELDRIRDNKKSWINNTSFINRPFVISNNLGGNSIRQTNYDVNDERLVLNSKEIDLDISLASAIETDVWCYIVDNPCLLTGITTCLPCIEECGNKSFQDDACYDFMDNEVYDFMDGATTGNTSDFNHSNCCGDSFIDFQSLLTRQLSAVTTVEDFEYFLTSELIDVKNRQTLSSYPTLRALYDRYMNSGLYCNTNSSRFDYVTMDQFASLVGNYWVDIVEQVIPATTIWGSVKIYSNTIFDQQKFKYKSYSTLLCGNPFSGESVPSPINGVDGMCVDVSVITTPIIIGTDDTLKLKSPISSICDSICIAQMNSNSEFIGTITIISN